MSTRISIITVTHNAAMVLPGLIDSLHAQTDREFEWIVVDGVSMDGTVEMIKSAGDVVGKWISEPDCGIYDAMNKAIGLASCEYYLVCGADDRLSPTAVADYRQAVSESSADIVSACVASDAGVSRPMRGQSWRLGHLAFVSQHSVGALIRKSLHLDFGVYSPRFPIAADQYFLKRVCMSPTVRLATADFIAGRYSMEGMSGSDIPGTMSEFFRVQLETERYPSLQVVLYLLRLVRYFGRIVAYGMAKRAVAQFGAPRNQ
jgi:glycosyltransferase involved in cell wall biosynthesis